MNRKPVRGSSRNANLGRTPAHLPRIERMIEMRSVQFPRSSGPMTMIGEDVSVRLDVVPAQFRVLLTRCPKYARRSLALPTEALITPVIVAKFGDRLPSYRQANLRPPRIVLHATKLSARRSRSG
jgi:transposase